jgi:serine/threonine-protein kinase HipA
VTRTLSVWWNSRIVGRLRINQFGEMSFVYDATWLSDQSRPALSFSLPKRPAPFKRRECRPFFAGLLPEEAQRAAAAAALGISRDNDFGLLEALGGDVAGALTLWPEGATPPAPNSGDAAKPLDDGQLVDIIDALHTRPLLAGRDGLRLSLAGAHAKLPKLRVVLVNGTVALPGANQATTHILKPPIARLPSTIENEALVMLLAKRIGLDVPDVEARFAGGRPYLLVTRYDRQLDDDGHAQRLHQEDFCQALGIPPERKHQSEGGPTFRTSFDLIRRATTYPAIATLAMLDAAIFNLIVGNADAHGKNFSLLYDNRGVNLAPFYDLLSTLAYPELAPGLAMKIGRRATLEEIGQGTWSAFAEEIGMAAPFIRRRTRTLAADVQRELPNVIASLEATGLDSSALTRFADLIAARAKRLAPSL